MAHQRQSTAILVGLSSILLGFLSGYLIGFKYGVNLSRGRFAEVQSPPPFLANASNATLDLETAEIIKELNCVCGCKMELAPCTCDEREGAQEIRSFIQTLVQQQMTRPEMVKRLIDKYGEAIFIKKT